MGIRKDETIHDKIKDVIDQLVEQGCGDREFTASELKKLIHDQCDIKLGSIIPTDYCYNRINQGIIKGNTFDDVRPRLLHYVKYGVFQCIGSNKPYSGTVKARPQGTYKDITVGEWIKGAFSTNEKWEDIYGN